MMRRIIFVLLLVLAFSCENDDYSIKYQFTGLSADHLSNVGSIPELCGCDSIPDNAYGIRLYLYPEIVSVGEANPDAHDYPPINVNRIDSIAITSDKDFDLNHPAGSSLTELFYYFNNGYFYTQPAEPTPYINNYYDIDFKNNPVPSHADFLLSVPAGSTEPHSFYIEIFLLDGLHFTTSLSPVKLY